MSIVNDASSQPLDKIDWLGKAGDPQDIRLRAALLNALRRLTTLEQERGPAATGDPNVEACRTCLRRANEEAARKARFVAWDCLHQFDDEMLVAMDEDERAARCYTLRAEAKEKLKGWRAYAAKCLTDQVEVGKPVPLQIVRELQAHLTTTAQNHQFKIELFERGSLPSLTVMLLLAVFGALAFSYVVLFMIDRPNGLLPWAHALVLGIPAGALGGILSMSFSLGQADLKAKIPDMRLSRLVTATRPLLAATVAIPVLVFVQAGYVKFAGFEGTLAILGFCFLAGFSERWFLGLMERFESGAK